MADKANERLKEQIKYEMEMLKFIALVMVALGGGAVSLFRNPYHAPIWLGRARIPRYTNTWSGELALRSAHTNAHRANRGYMTPAEWLALGISAAILTIIVVTLWKIAHP